MCKPFTRFSADFGPGRAASIRRSRFRRKVSACMCRCRVAYCCTVCATIFFTSYILPADNKHALVAFSSFLGTAGQLKHSGTIICFTWLVVCQVLRRVRSSLRPPSFEYNIFFNSKRNKKCKKMRTILTTVHTSAGCCCCVIEISCRNSSLRATSCV